MAAAITAPRPEAKEGWLTAARARLIGWSLFGAGMILRLVALVLVSQIGPGAARFTFDIGVPTFLAAILLGTASGLVGAIIVARRPTNTVGWLYVGTGILQGVVTTGLAYAALTLVSNPNPLATSMAWLNGVVDFAIPFSFAALVLGLFPDGRLLGPRWRIVVGLAVVGGFVRAFEVGFGEPSLVLMVDEPNPYRVSGTLGRALEASSALGIGSLLVEVAAVLGAVSLAVRYRASAVDGRRQILWLLLAGGLAVISSLPLLYGTLRPGGLPAGFDALALIFATLCLAPIATLIAITRYRLYEIDRIVNRAIVYGSLSAILAGVFTAAIGLAQRLFVAMTGETSDAAIVLTTLVVATLYAPLRKRLEGLVDRRFKYDVRRFGAYRDEVSKTLSVIDADAAAERLAREAARELQAVGAAVLDRGGAVVASSGSWPSPVMIHLGIPGGGDTFDVLAIGPRTDGRAHDPRAVAELEELATLVARAVRPPAARPPAARPPAVRP